jgi:NADH-quinone oxidoreductase subunit N
MFLPEMISSLDARLLKITECLFLMIPELVIISWIFVSLFAELFLHGKTEKFATSWRYFIAQLGILLALVLSMHRIDLSLNGYASFQLFAINAGSNSMNTLLLLFAFLILSLSQIQGKRFQLEEKIGFFSILGGALLTCLSAHWLSIYLSIEWMSMGTYLLVGIRKDASGSKASIPYVLFGLATSALLLYGISLIYGITGTLSLGDPAFTRGISDADPVLIGTVFAMVGAGFLFKMSWVPFQPWSPDVLETLPASWMAWISIAPKMAITYLGIRLLHIIPISYVEAICLLAILTLLVGNLGALRQSNTKRLLAYSSIAHGGFMAMAWIFPSTEAVPVLLFYSLLYGISSILVFFALDENSSELVEKNDLEKWAGLSKLKPIWSLFVLIGFVAFIGLPPTGTFIAKVTYFSLIWQVYQNSGLTIVLILLFVAIFTTAISVFYYLKIPFQIYFKNRPSSITLTAKENLASLWPYALLCLIIVLTTIFPNLVWNIWK